MYRAAPRHRADAGLRCESSKCSGHFPTGGICSRTIVTVEEELATVRVGDELDEVEVARQTQHVVRLVDAEVLADGAEHFGAVVLELERRAQLRKRVGESRRSRKDFEIFFYAEFEKRRRWYERATYLVRRRNERRPRVALGGERELVDVVKVVFRERLFFRQRRVASLAGERLTPVVILHGQAAHAHLVAHAGAVHG
eukprot:scaffold923_cov256-Pinguiococcus_pyrenoidosus.AAC.60